MCCLATARLTTNVLSCLSSICSYSYPSSQHSQTHCHPILHYQTCLLNLALRPGACLFLHALSCTIRLAAYVFSSLLPRYSQTHCLCILRLTAYVFSGSLPIYSQAHCQCILRLTAYLVSGSLPMYSQAHCLCILRLTAYVFSGSLLSILRLTANVFSGSPPI